MTDGDGSRNRYRGVEATEIETATNKTFTIKFEKLEAE